MAYTAKLSEKFQISIPKTVREARNWKAGQEFAFVPRDGSVQLVPIPAIEDLRGIAKGADPEGYRDRKDDIDACR